VAFPLSKQENRSGKGETIGKNGIESFPFSPDGVSSFLSLLSPPIAFPKTP
jgi:hypothetical protein